MTMDTPGIDGIPFDRSRRDLLRAAGLVTGGALLLGLPKSGWNWISPAQAAVSPTAKVVANVFLELDGSRVLLAAVDGGSGVADVVTNDLGPDNTRLKHVANRHFEDIVLQVPLAGVSKALVDWIADMLLNRSAGKDGAIVFADLNFSEIKRLEFVDAVLAEATLPAADARDLQTPAVLTLRISPVSTRWTGGSGQVIQSVKATASAPALSGIFRFNVQGLEPACTRIMKIEPLQATRQIIQTLTGVSGPTVKTGSSLDYNNIAITLPENDGAYFYQWFDDFVLKGNNGQAQERAGLLEWFSADRRKVIASALLSNLGIVKYAPEPYKAGVDTTTPLARVEMYFESMRLNLATG